MGVFFASLQHGGRQEGMPLSARRKGDPDSHDAPKNRGQITYRFPPYTYTQNPEDFLHLKDPGKIAGAMWRDYVKNSGQTSPKLHRPSRHYPAHHYKRQMRQRIGLQRKEARIQKVISDSIVPHRIDDFTTLHPVHHEKILDAFDKLDVWKRMAKTREAEINQAESEDTVPVSVETKQVVTMDSDTEAKKRTDFVDESWDTPLGNLEELGPKDDVKDTLDITDYDGHKFNETDYRSIGMDMEDDYDEDYGGESYVGDDDSPGNILTDGVDDDEAL